MDWNKLLSTTRLGMEDWTSSDKAEDRSQFQRDYDRIIFSSPFRRMQNKTQVFPLPQHICFFVRKNYGVGAIWRGDVAHVVAAKEILPNYRGNHISVNGFGCGDF